MIFRHFYRADEARRTPGNGLGLGLVKAIADMHGFRVEARNVATGGARFTILCRGRISADGRQSVSG